MPRRSVKKYKRKSSRRRSSKKRRVSRKKRKSSRRRKSSKKKRVSRKRRASRRRKSSKKRRVSRKRRASRRRKSSKKRKRKQRGGNCEKLENGDVKCTELLIEKKEVDARQACGRKVKKQIQKDCISKETTLARCHATINRINETGCFNFPKNKFHLEKFDENIDVKKLKKLRSQLEKESKEILKKYVYETSSDDEESPGYKQTLQFFETLFLNGIDKGLKLYEDEQDPTKKQDYLLKVSKEITETFSAGYGMIYTFIKQTKIYLLNYLHKLYEELNKTKLTNTELYKHKLDFYFTITLLFKKDDHYVMKLKNLITGIENPKLFTKPGTQQKKHSFQTKCLNSYVKYIEGTNDSYDPYLCGDFIEKKNMPDTRLISNIHDLQYYKYDIFEDKNKLSTFKLYESEYNYITDDKEFVERKIEIDTNMKKINNIITLLNENDETKLLEILKKFDPNYSNKKRGYQQVIRTEKYQDIFDKKKCIKNVLNKNVDIFKKYDCILLSLYYFIYKKYGKLENVSKKREDMEKLDNKFKKSNHYLNIQNLNNEDITKKYDIIKLDNPNITL
jgi:hypothetical protein